MRITDELRKYAEKAVERSDYMGGLTFDLRRIAERIDAEHEAKVSYWQGASYKDGYDEGFANADDWMADHEDAMAEHGWVKMPVDADGAPIRVGDEVRLVNGRTVEVAAIGVKTFMAWSPDDCRYTSYIANKCRHVQPDSWERIIKDAMEAYQFDDGSSEPSIGSLVERCKRLAGENA